MIRSIRKFGLAMACVAVVGSVIGLLSKGLNYGMDFTGGVVTEFTTAQPLSQQQLQDAFTSVTDAELRLNGGQDGHTWTLRQSDDTDMNSQQELVELVAQTQELQLTIQESAYMGAQIGEELFEKGGLALLMAALSMMMYVTLRFDWRLASSAIVALLHDVMVVLGIFVWWQVNFDLNVLAALLAIMGYSLNDSIVIGDRIRELMRYSKEDCLEQLVDNAIKSTLRRTAITSLTTLITIVAIGVMAGEVLGGFALSLGIGVVIGTFSSLSIAATLPLILKLPRDAYNQLETSHTESQVTQMWVERL